MSEQRPPGANGKGHNGGPDFFVDPGLADDFKDKGTLFCRAQRADRAELAKFYDAIRSQAGTRPANLR